MAKKYSGALMARYSTANDVRTPYPDKRHASDWTEHEYDGSDHYPDNHQVPADQGSEFVGTSMPVDQAVGGGTVLADPQFTHDGAPIRPLYSQDQYRDSRVELLHGEGPDRGWIGDAYSEPSIQDARTVYGEELQDGQLIPMNPNTEGAPVLLRGINAYPMNNPDREGYERGVRPGRHRWLWALWDRPLHRRSVTGYQPQPLYVRDHLVPVDTPAPADPPFYGPVVSSWLPSWANRRDMVPALWRDPGEVDDSLLAASPADADVVISGDL